MSSVLEKLKDNEHVETDRDISNLERLWSEPPDTSFFLEDSLKSKEKEAERQLQEEMKDRVFCKNCKHHQNVMLIPSLFGISGMITLIITMCIDHYVKDRSMNGVAFFTFMYSVITLMAFLMVLCAYLSSDYEPACRTLPQKSTEYSYDKAVKKVIYSKPKERNCGNDCVYYQASRWRKLKLKLGFFS
jgi:hypothetical protein